MLVLESAIAFVLEPVPVDATGAGRWRGLDEIYEVGMQHIGLITAGSFGCMLRKSDAACREGMRMAGRPRNHICEHGCRKHT